MQAAARRKVRLLMVDDNPGDVELFRWALKHAHIDYELSVIGDGGEALEMLRREGGSASSDKPDLVVLDLNLPKADGREILAAMRSTAGFTDVPVVILTSSTSVRDRGPLEALRIARHITKPLDLGEFLKLGSTVREVLEESEASR